MKIRADGFVMKMAYPDYSFGERVNLCPLFWRFVLMTFVVRLFLMPFFWIGLNIIGLLQAEGYYVFDFVDCDLSFRNFKNWPKVEGHKILPTAVILGLFASFGLTLELMSLPVAFWFYSGIAILAIGLIAGLVYAFGKGPVRETLSLAGNFIVAKYRKVCPSVEVVRSPR